MVFLDQIISNLEQPLCVVRKHDREILYKNLNFSKHVSTVSTNKFDELFTMYCDKKNNNLAELISNHSLTEATHLSQPSCIYVHLIPGKLLIP